MDPIEHPRMHVVEVKIPEGVAFADLRVARDADGHVSFAVDPLQRVCEASGIDLDTVMASEDSAVAFIFGWYRAHLACGGAPDPTVEDLRAEVEAEDRYGGGISYPPGSG
ncbi:hypothetical protein [Metallibacterium scheffleri]|uniref:hypothetical protein n=1 Tax=Metallibacterium scheffleri TaxID=993689 RepID=UPI0023EF799B|nr:hypothetical protein [Metallibacterium scheffleri]